MGPGWGKYGVLVREYLQGVKTVDAVEGWAPYVTPMLLGIYDAVFTTDVMAFPAPGFSNYDLVLMVDVFEHLTREDGLELLDRMPQAHVVICTPRDFFQNPEADTIWTEMHRSVWSVVDFTEMRRCVEAYENGVAAIMALLGPA